jgi:rare lipoprotein A
MIIKQRFNRNGAAMMLGACMVGLLAGTSSMVAMGAPQQAAATAAAAGLDQAGGDQVVPNEPSTEPGMKRHLDRSGRKQVGKASFYKDTYAGKTMADGTPMRLYSNNAASLTLPLGTTARVKNLHTGKTAIVTIRDRGPYVKGRIVDLSPGTARSIGLSKKQGVADVEVTPISFPDAPAPNS